MVVSSLYYLDLWMAHVREKLWELINRLWDKMTAEVNPRETFRPFLNTAGVGWCPMSSVTTIKLAHFHSLYKPRVASNLWVINIGHRSFKLPPFNIEYIDKLVQTWAHLCPLKSNNEKTEEKETFQTKMLWTHGDEVPNLQEFGRMRLWCEQRISNFIIGASSQPVSSKFNPSKIIYLSKGL